MEKELSEVAQKTINEVSKLAGIDPKVMADMEREVLALLDAELAKEPTFDEKFHNPMKSVSADLNGILTAKVNYGLGGHPPEIRLAVCRRIIQMMAVSIHLSFKASEEWLPKLEAASREQDRLARMAAAYRGPIV